MTGKVRLLFLLGSVGVLDTVVVFLIGGGFHLGVMLPGLIGLLLLGAGLVKANIINHPSILVHNNLKRFLVFGFIIAIISFFSIQLLIFSAIKDASKQPCDYLLVLGGGLRETKPTLALQARLKRSVKYFNNHPGIKKIIVSGGQGPFSTLPEAEVMKRFLVQHGIEGEKIIPENKASSTMENLKFTKQILSKLNFSSQDRITVITSEFHLWRTQFLADRNGLQIQTVPAQTPWYVLPNLALREYFAVVKSYIWDR